MIDLDYTIKVRLPIIIFAVLITYGMVFWLATPTRKGYGYAPEQPIAFSHKLHAGVMQLDCKYCHVGVDQSRHATIPSVDTCMNCHNTVRAVGRDPQVFSYDEHIAKKDKTVGDAAASILSAQKEFKDQTNLFSSIAKAKDGKEIAGILNGVIEVEALRNDFLKTYSNGKYQHKEISVLVANDKRTEVESQKLVRLMMDELFTIDSYYSAEIQKLVKHYEDGTPLKWKRIYRLPAYAYFSHSAHVNKNIDCSNCHGNVEDLDHMKKMKPITMGRCLDCHRGDYKEYHKDLTEKAVGPENCGACHR